MTWRYALLVTATVVFATNSQAQHAHDEGHYDYNSWASKRTGNCCNDNNDNDNKDYGFLNADEVKIPAR